MAEPVLSIHGVSFRYGNKTALEDIHLELHPGELVGLLGPNGAGKSTLVRCAVGLERPTAGEVRLAGSRIPQEVRKVRHRIGYMSQSPALFEDLSAGENLLFFGAPFQPPGKELAKRADEILDFLDLRGAGDMPVGHFSGGMKQRLSLGCALMHRPEILFLDEPTAGVDPLIAKQIWDALQEMTRSGLSILLCTHLPEEMHRCNRVAVLRQGRLVATATPDRFAALAPTRVRLYRSTGMEEREVATGGEDLAHLLYPWGLKRDILRLEVIPPTVEEALVILLGKGHQNDQQLAGGGTGPESAAP